MPRIPMSSKANLIGHVRSGVPLNAHGIGHTPVRNDGETLLRAQQQLDAGVASLADFWEKKQGVENKLAAAEDRALLRESANELYQKIADDPNAPDEEKEEWIRRFQFQYEEKRQEMLERMTPEFRKQHDVEITSMKKDIASRQLLLLTQSTSQRLKNETTDNYKRFCDSGDFDEAKKLIERTTGDVWTPEQAKHLLEVDLPMRRDFAAVKRLADDIPQKALDELQEKDKNGNYINYTHLTPENRRSLLRYAQGVANAKEMEEDRAIAASYKAGKKLYSDEKLKDLHEGHAITDRQYVRYKNWNKAFDREQSTLATRQANLRKAKRQQEVNAYYATALYNPDGSPKILSQADAAKICLEGKEKYFGPDADGLTAFYDRVYSQVAKIEKQKDFAQSDAGKAILKYINDKDLSAFYWDTWAIGDEKNNVAFNLSQKLQLLSIAEKEYTRNNGNVEATINALDARLKDLNKGKITSILQGYPVPDIQVGKYTLPAAEQKPKVRTGTYKGRKVEEINGKWQYVE